VPDRTRSINETWTDTVPAVILATMEESVVMNDRIGGVTLSRASSVRFDGAWATG
jgi:hypothetical protein